MRLGVDDGSGCGGGGGGSDGGDGWVVNHA